MENVVVFPNPFVSEIFITVKKQNASHVIFSIKNILGQTVYSDQENNLSGSYTKPFDLSFLANGVYLPEVIFDGEGREEDCERVRRNKFVRVACVFR